jgi:hypothetical protein
MGGGCAKIHNHSSNGELMRQATSQLKRSHTQGDKIVDKLRIFRKNIEVDASDGMKRAEFVGVG